VLTSLTDAGIPFAVGGTYAMEELAGLVRQTKDLDLFVRAHDWPLSSAGSSPRRGSARRSSSRTGWARRAGTSCSWI
jgi:hypothetical protein